MFIIFGWGRQTVKEHGPVLKYHCAHCNNDKHWVLYTRRTWFTLFFIPVIPYSTEYLMMCPICKYGVKLEKDRFEEYKQIALCNMDLIHKRITQEEHVLKLQQLLRGDSGRSADDIEMEGKTETQKNYLRQLKEIEEEKAAKAAMEALASNADAADTSAAKNAEAPCMEENAEVQCSAESAQAQCMAEMVTDAPADRSEPVQASDADAD